MGYLPYQLVQDFFHQQYDAVQETTTSKQIFIHWQTPRYSKMASVNSSADVPFPAFSYCRKCAAAASNRWLAPGKTTRSKTWCCLKSCILGIPGMMCIWHKYSHSKVSWLRPVHWWRWFGEIPLQQKNFRYPMPKNNTSHFNSLLVTTPNFKFSWKNKDPLMGI